MGNELTVKERAAPKKGEDGVVEYREHLQSLIAMRNANKVQRLWLSIADLPALKKMS